MGTSNFHTVNASKTFVVQYHPEDDEEAPDFWYDEEVEYIKERLSECKNIGEPLGYTIADRDELRCHPSRSLATFYRSKEYKVAGSRFLVAVQITAIIRSGYYEAASLDWQIDYDLNDRFEDLEEEEIKYDIQYLTDCSDKQAIQYAGYARKWASDQKDQMVEELEKEFSKLTEVYIKLGTFSNGESIYQKL